MIENVILNNLIHNENYGRKVIPFLKEEYFSDYSQKIIYGLIDTYVKKYNTFPTIEAIAIDLTNKEGINEETFKRCKDVLSGIKPEEQKTDIEWLVDQTEKFCQEKAVYNAIMQSITILDDKTGKISKGAIPQILSDALAVSFDTQIGHDFLEDSDARYEFYHKRDAS